MTDDRVPPKQQLQDPPAPKQQKNDAATAKVRDVIPISKLTLRSDLTLDWPSYPGGTRVIEASEQVRIEYHHALGFYIVDWKPRPGGTERPFRKLVPREWAAFEPL